MAFGLHLIPLDFKYLFTNEGELLAAEPNAIGVLSLHTVRDDLPQDVGLLDADLNFPRAWIGKHMLPLVTHVFLRCRAIDDTILLTCNEACIAIVFINEPLLHRSVPCLV